MGAEFVLWWIKDALFPLFNCPSLAWPIAWSLPKEGRKNIGIEWLIKHEPDT
jgi:hypothetical protein